MTDYTDVAKLQYKAFNIDIKLDTSKDWRIYVEKNSQVKIMPFDVPETDPYMMVGSDSSFGLEGFPFALWNYGDCFGLDQFPRSKESTSTVFSKNEKIWSSDEIKTLGRKLVDCILAYQVNFKLINEYRRFDYSIELIKNAGFEFYSKKNHSKLVNLIESIDEIDITTN